MQQRAEIPVRHVDAYQDVTLDESEREPELREAMVYGATLPVWLTVMAGALMIVLPIVCYPWSKTLRMVVDLRINPYSSGEQPRIR